MWCERRLTPQAQRPGARDATIVTATLPPGSLQRMVRRYWGHVMSRRATNRAPLARKLRGQGRLVRAERDMARNKVWVECFGRTTLWSHSIAHTRRLDRID